MAKKKPKPKKQTGSAWMLRFYSGRGTDQRICVILKDGTTPKQALEIAEEWAEKQTAGSCCHSYSVEVFRVALPANRAAWLKEWKRLSDIQAEAEANWKNWREVGYPHDWSEIY